MAGRVEALRSSLTAAKDEEVTRLVALLDGMHDRGALDGLLAVLRPRLARLRPERPLRFARLLFLPLDPLVVPAARSSVDKPTIPRTALRPIADVVRGMIGTCAVDVDAMIKGHSTRNHAIVARAGALLWPAAAEAIARSTAPADWTNRTGLSGTEYDVLADNIALVMAQVPRLRLLLVEVEAGIPIRPDALHGMLRPGQPVALAMMVALILDCLPQALAALAHPPRRHQGLPAALNAAKQVLLDRLELKDVIEAALMGAAAPAAAAEVRRMVMLLRMLRDEPAPGSATRVQRLLDRLDKACLARFTAGLRQEFIQPMEALQHDAGDDEIIRLEDAARGLRDIAVAGAMIGGNRTYDILVRRVADAVKTHAPQGPLTLGDRARLVELLIGPESAWRMLEALSAG